MQLFTGRSLKTKLMIINMVTSLIALVMVFFFILPHDYQAFKKSLTIEMTILAQILASNCEAAVYFDDPEAAAETLAALSAQPQVLIAVIYKPNGDVFARYSAPGSQSAALPPRSERADLLSSQSKIIFGQLHVHHPILVEEDIIGFLCISSSLKPLSARFKRNIAMAMFVLAGAMIVSLLFSFLLLKFVSKPILHLVKTAKAISSARDYSLRAHIFTNDELGALTRVFNDMLTQVQKRDLELARYSRNLEEQIKERMLVESKLSASEEKFRQIANSANDGIVVLDHSGQIIFWNKSAQGLFSYKEKEVFGRSMRDLLLKPDKFDAFLKTILAEQLDSTGPFKGNVQELMALNKDRRSFPVEISVSTTFIRGEWNFILIIRDITERKIAQNALKQAKEEAENASKLKSDFLSMVSHELRTPLTSIIGFAKIIHKRLESTIYPAISIGSPKVVSTRSKLRQNIHIIISEGNRLTELINDVLDLNKLEADKIEWRLEPAHIPDLIKHSLRATDSLFKKSNLTKKIIIDKNLPLVMCDHSRIIQVLINLISNSVKFTSQGCVTCKAHNSGSSIVVSVSDTGIGIPSSELANIFQKFKQLGDTLTNRPKGTGLGLAICSEIINHHKGKIWAESTPGQGSTFYFSLPVTPPA